MKPITQARESNTCQGHTYCLIVFIGSTDGSLALVTKVQQIHFSEI